MDTNNSQQSKISFAEMADNKLLFKHDMTSEEFKDKTPDEKIAIIGTIIKEFQEMLAKQNRYVTKQQIDY